MVAKLSRRTVAAILVFGFIACARALPSSEPSSAASNGVRFPAEPSKQAKESPAKDNEASGAAARFGFLTNSIYPGTYSSSTGQYAASSPLKLDLGGLLVGGALGLGLIFLVPKLFQPYGGGCYNARSVDDGEPTLMSRLDKALATHDIDTSACAQRVLCAYVHQAASKAKTEAATNFDRIVGDMSSKASAEKIFGNSAYQRALDVGREGGDCAVEFPKCPSDTAKVFDAVKTFVIGSIV